MGGISKLPRTHFGGVQVQAEECAADLKVHDRLLPLSFETGEQASHKRCTCRRRRGSRRCASR